MVLSGLAKVASIEAFDLVVPYLNDDAVVKEAEIAVVQIGFGLGKEYTERVMPVIKRVNEETTNEELREASFEYIQEHK
jgi:hypothetical protein